MPSLVNLPVEILDQIINLVLIFHHPPPTFPSDTTPRSLANDFKYSGWYRENANVLHISSPSHPTYQPNAQGLLGASRHLRNETLALLSRTGGVHYSLDVVLTGGLQLQPTWTCIPCLPRPLSSSPPGRIPRHHVDKVSVTLHCTGQPYLRHGCGGPPQITWPFWHLLQRFLRTGPVPPLPLLPTTTTTFSSSSSPHHPPIRPDRRISITHLSLRIIPSPHPRQQQQQQQPDTPNPAWRPRIYHDDGGRPTTDAEYASNPARGDAEDLCRAMKGSFVPLMVRAGWIYGPREKGEYCRDCVERVGAISVRFDDDGEGEGMEGKEWGREEIWDVGAALAEDEVGIWRKPMAEEKRRWVGKVERERKVRGFREREKWIEELDGQSPDETCQTDTDTETTAADEEEEEKQPSLFRKWLKKMNALKGKGKGKKAGILRKS
ncbi:MAG: hypothetical protein Q9227_003729 [Pyrenula ochraceoflavens]